MNEMISEYLSSLQMKNRKETGTKTVVKKEEVNDGYSAVANAGDQKKPSEKAKKRIDSMFRHSVKVENTEFEQPAKNSNEAKAKRPATIAPISIKVENNGSTDRPESATSTTTSAATGVNERSFWESDPENHDDGFSDNDGDVNETESSKQRQVEANSNNANGCDGGQLTCLDCAAVFEANADFKVHIATHAVYRGYKCTVCEKRFTRSDVLKIHMRIHTGERPFHCDVCEMKFTQSGDLKVHKRIHTGDKPFECDVCGKKFTTSGHLTIHKRFHTGERPYKCEICHKGFADSSNLRTHKRVHTGEKPYKCLTCGKCFSRSSGLQRHKLTHAEPVADTQLDVSQKGVDQPSTIDACDPRGSSINGQKILLAGTDH